MNAQNSNHQIAMDLISQYGEDAESIRKELAPTLLVTRVSHGRLSDDHLNYIGSYWWLMIRRYNHDLSGGLG